jgi:gluconokinase
MDAPTAVVLMGVAGSGKSHVGRLLAEALGARFVEGDAYHSDENRARMQAAIPLTDADRAPWLSALAAALQQARVTRERVVLSCSALRRAYRDVLRAGNRAAQFVWLHADAETLRARLLSRADHYMPAALLDSQLATLEVPTADEQVWQIDARMDAAGIVDAVQQRLGHGSTQ